MSRFRVLASLFGLLGLLICSAAHADLYSAQQAYDKKDFVRAFALYREIAEMGHPVGQETLAVMYVNGEGVKRDNVLGYGWALIANENSQSDIALNIISQLEPHLTDAARQRVAELQAQFGRAALQERLLPEATGSAAKPASSPNPNGCEFLKPANPDDYYPREARLDGLSGTVLVEYVVMPDGRARNPRVLNALPTRVFDAAATSVVFNSTFKPQRENGVAVPCSIKIKVKFVSMGGVDGSTSPELRKFVADARTNAIAGDPTAQLRYALLREVVKPTSADTFSDPPVNFTLKAAQAGLPLAQYLIGTSLLANPNLPRNEDKALIWLNKAVDAGQADAQAELASYLLRRSGDASDRPRAYELLDRSAASGCRAGKYRLASLLAADADESRRNPRRALELLEELMGEKQNDPTAWEIRAAADAMLGDFKAAQEDQKRANRLAASYGWDLAPQKARLANYQNNTTWTGDLLAL